jgi:ribosomal protein L35
MRTIRIYPPHVSKEKIIFIHLLSTIIMAKAGKTHKSMAKRIKVTKNNKLMHAKSRKRHLLTNKGRTTKKNTLGKELHKSEARRVQSLISTKLR